MGCSESKAAEPVLTGPEQAPAAETTPATTPAVVQAAAPEAAPAVEVLAEDSKVAIEPSQVVVKTAAEEVPAVVAPPVQAPIPEVEMAPTPEPEPAAPVTPVADTAPAAETVVAAEVPPPPSPVQEEAEPITDDLAIESGEASTVAAGAGLRASLRESSVFSMLKNIGTSLKDFMVGGAEPETEPEPESTPEEQAEAAVKMQATLRGTKARQRKAEIEQEARAAKAKAEAAAAEVDVLVSAMVGRAIDAAAEENARNASSSSTAAPRPNPASLEENSDMPEEKHDMIEGESVFVEVEV